mmetsp:Transcript_12153/g.40340  ORF Transcript_12153/g.40340 Transcript_12153/m.40340 type:complete len:219 (-) Transcript_12153:153-809(-)
MFEIRIPHLLPFVVRHRAESFPDGHHHDHAVGLATGAEHQLGVRRRLRVNHHRHLALAFRHHGVQILRRGFVAERTHDGARDTHADRAFPVEMFQHFRHSQPHALLRHVFQRRGHSRALELGVRRVHGSSLERVHAQLHTENNLAFGVIPFGNLPWRTLFTRGANHRASVTSRWTEFRCAPRRGTRTASRALKVSGIHSWRRRHRDGRCHVSRGETTR